MRSRLEARWAAWLDWAGVDWIYEPRGAATGTWLPDFQIMDGTARLLAEVKPSWEQYELDGGHDKYKHPDHAVCVLIGDPGVGGTPHWGVPMQSGGLFMHDRDWLDDPATHLYMDLSWSWQSGKLVAR